MRPLARLKRFDPLPAKTGQAEGEASALGDLRFRALLSEAEWAALPVSIRKRFSKRLRGGDTAVYVGEVIETQMNLAGFLLAQGARLIGGPLPVSRDAHVPSVVTVTEDVASNGQHWTRLYARRRGFPQGVHSSKRFACPHGSRRGRSVSRTRSSGTGASSSSSTSFTRGSAGSSARPPPSRRRIHDHDPMDPDRDPDCAGSVRPDLSPRADRAARLAAFAAP